MFSHNDLDLQIKQEPILDEANAPPPYGNGYIKQESPSYINNSILYAMGSDLLPKTKRLRTEETEDVNTLKRIKIKEGAPNFRRPWPTTVKSSALYSNTNERNSPHSFTNFSISNLMQGNNSKSKDTINDNELQNPVSNNVDIPKNNFHDGNLKFQDNNEYKELDTNFIKKEPNVHKSYFENLTLTATMISQVQKDLNITNDSDDNENGYINNQSGISENDTSHVFNNNTNIETSDDNKVYDSNLFWTVQNGNAEHLKMIISKENNSPNPKNASKIKDNGICLHEEEQQLELANNEKRIVSKNPNIPFNVSKSNMDIAKAVLSVESITSVSKKQSVMKNYNNTLDIAEQTLDVPKKQKVNSMGNTSEIKNSNTEQIKILSPNENKTKSSKKKSKKKEKKHKKHLDIYKQPFEIYNKENSVVSNNEREMSISSVEPLKVVISKDKKSKSGKKSKRKEKNKYDLNHEETLTAINKGIKNVCTPDNKILNPHNKEKSKIKLESSFEYAHVPAGNNFTLSTPLRTKIKLESSFEHSHAPANNNLKVSTPLRDITKNKSKAIKRYSLPNTSNIQQNSNDSSNKNTNDRKIAQAPRVFMKKIKWTNILQKENMYMDTRVKIHKMIFCQEDGATSEIAVKAHLENLDWPSLGVIPKTMVVEEGAALANLQGIKGVPYLCGVIIEEPPALVMSYYKGRTLGDYLEEGDTLLALRAFSRACETVGKIHHRGWAHYDIHADNILGRVNNNNSMTVTLLNYGFCRTTSVNPHYGIYSDQEDLEGHHLPADIINQKCNGTYVDRYSLCYILEEITSQLKEVPETIDIRDASSLGLMTDQPHLRPSSSHLAQLVSKLVSRQTHDTWKFGIDD